MKNFVRSYKIKNFVRKKRKRRRRRKRKIRKTIKKGKKILSPAKTTTRVVEIASKIWHLWSITEITEEVCVEILKNKVQTRKRAAAIFPEVGTLLPSEAPTPTAEIEGGKSKHSREAKEGRTAEIRGSPGTKTEVPRTPETGMSKMKGRETEKVVILVLIHFRHMTSHSLIILVLCNAQRLLIL